jgi:DNA-binding IclR family transcriptional regulator
MKTYKRIASLEKGLQIISHISEGTQSIKSLTDKITMPIGTLHCYLATLEDLKIIVINGDQITFGHWISEMKSNRLKDLLLLRAAIDAEIEEFNKDKGGL